MTTLTELLHAHRGSTAAGMRVCTIARVESYSAARQSITAQPLIMTVDTDPYGERVVKRAQPIPNVPVCMPSTAAGFRFTIPLSAGDTVVLVYADRSLDKWSIQGGEVDPVDERAHHASDAIAFPCVRDFAHPIANVSENPSIGYAAALLEFTSSQIRAGGTGQLATLADLQALRSWVVAQFSATGGHTHVVVGGATTTITTVAGPGTAPTFPPSTPSGTSILRGA